MVQGNVHGHAIDQPQANAKMVISVGVVMLGSIVYGIDNQFSGVATGYAGFVKDWCNEHFLDGPHSCSQDSPADGGDAPILKNSGYNLFIFWSGFLIYIGAGFGVILMAPIVADYFGRRACVSAGGLVTFIACLGNAYMSFGNVVLYLVWRFFIGFGIGSMCFAVPIYNSEVATPATRGTLGALYQFSVCIGQLIGSAVLAKTDSWHVALLFPGGAAFIVGLLVWTVPETPRWVMQKKGFEQGLAILKSIRATDPTAEGEEMERKIQEEKQLPPVSYGQLWSNKNLRYRVFVATWLQIAQKFTFIDSFFNFWSTICLHMHITDAQSFSLIFQIPNNLGAVASFILMDMKCGGRKCLLLLSSVVVCIAYVGIPMMPTPGTAKIFMILWIFGWQLAWGSVCWLLPSELFSMAEKKRALSVPTFVQFMFNPFQGLLASMVMEKSGTTAFFYMGAGFMVLHIIFVLTCVRETKGVPLEDVPALYGDRKKELLAAA